MKPTGRVAKRGAAKRERRPIVMFSAEGDNKTETLYLQNFNKDRYPHLVRCRGNDTDPVGMMKQLIAEAESAGLDISQGDMAFCLIDADTDTRKQKQIDEADSMQSDLVRLIVSVPCFEIWFLCHFTGSARYRTNTDTIDELRKYIPQYEKSRDIYSRIQDNTSTAVQNAKQFERRNTETGRDCHSVESNPSTEVYKVIEFITKDK